jgi:hypothetical protein
MDSTHTDTHEKADRPNASPTTFSGDKSKDTPLMSVYNPSSTEDFPAPMEDPPEDGSQSAIMRRYHR